jgi:hypothetical protein
VDLLREENQVRFLPDQDLVVAAEEAQELLALLGAVDPRARLGSQSVKSAKNLNSEKHHHWVVQLFRAGMATPLFV